MNKIDKIRESIPVETHTDLPSASSFNGTKLSLFAPTTIEEVSKILKESGIKTSPEDPIPVCILKSVYEVTLPVLVSLINKSLAEGSVEGIKHSVIDPSLKKALLDSEIKKNYRPINNLVFLSKLSERIVLIRLDEHLASNNLHNNLQYGYKKFHSTETMMLGITNELFDSFDDYLCNVMMFLDLSAAFDTLDINKMMHALSHEIGLEGAALRWCKSFLLGRTQRVKINNVFSESLEIKYGTPQGSVLGPRFFDIYIRSQPEIFKHCNFKSTAYADDSNGMKKFAITFQYNVLKNDVPHCLETIAKWMNLKFLKINPDKTEIVVFLPAHLSSKLIINGTILTNGECIRFSNSVKNVGFTLDKHLKMDKHVNKIVSHCFKLIKDLWCLRSFTSPKDMEILVNSSVTSRLDYCNSLFFNMAKSNFQKLQKVQNAAARLVLRKSLRSSASEMLKQLHWLPIHSRCIFISLLLMFKYVNGICPSNFTFEYKTFNGPYSYRAQDSLMLKTITAKTKYGKRKFEYYGPRLWNRLTYKMRTEKNIEIFKKKLKTLLFDNSDTLKDI